MPVLVGCLALSAPRFAIVLVVLRTACAGEHDRRWLFHAHGSLIAPLLVKHHRGGAAVDPHLERQLRVGPPEKELLLRLGVDFKRWLSRHLHEEPAVFAANPQPNRRRELIAADVAVEHLGGNRDFGS